MNTVRKAFCVIFSLAILIGTAIPAYASDNIGQLDKEGISVGEEVVGGQDVINPISPQWNPGDGPAPQVSQIQLANYGILESNGHFCVILKVNGYGSDITYFNGQRVYWFQQDPFIEYGIGADGFYYWYDCGEVTQAGTYSFSSTFTSTNFPYTQRSYSTSFIFSE